MCSVLFRGAIDPPHRAERRGKIMHRYRSHTCGALRAGNAGETARLSGWVHRVRDHGGVLFIDLRDHYGLTQIVADPDSPAFAVAETVRAEWCLRIDGMVKPRTPETVNADLPTGEIEVFASEIEILSDAIPQADDEGDQAERCREEQDRLRARPSGESRRRRSSEE